MEQKKKFDSFGVHPPKFSKRRAELKGKGVGRGGGTGCRADGAGLFRRVPEDCCFHDCENMAPPLVPIRSMVLLALCVVSAGRGVVKVPTRAAMPVDLKGDSSAALVAGTQGSTEGMACGIEFEGEDSGSKRKGARSSAKGRRSGGGGGGGGENGKKRSAAGDGGSEKARNAEGNDAKKRKKADEKGLLTLAGRRGRGKRGKGRGGESSKTGQLEIVCKRCRKEKSKNSQNSLMSYFSSSPAKFTTNSDTPTAADTSQGTEKGGGQAGDAGGDSGDDRLICSRCRTSMEEKIPQKGRLPASSIRRGCPTVIKIYNYKRNARNKEVMTISCIAGDVDLGFRIRGSNYEECNGAMQHLAV